MSSKDKLLSLSSLTAVPDSYTSISKNACSLSNSLGSDTISSSVTVFVCFSLPSPVTRAGEAGRVIRSLYIIGGSCRSYGGPPLIRDNL